MKFTILNSIFSIKSVLIIFVFLFSFSCSSDENSFNKTDGDLDSIDKEEAVEQEESDEQEKEKEIVIGRGLPNRPDYAPSLLVRPEDKDRILKRIEKEPFKSILEDIKKVAAKPHHDLDPPTKFDSDEQKNGEIAQAAAFLAWLLDDKEMADKARDFLKKLSDDYDSHEDNDINIRMPSISMCYAFALDLLEGGNFIPEDEAKDAERKLAVLIDALFEEYFTNDFKKLALYMTQNNHPIRTACAIGTVALAFPEQKEAAKWANWAFSELDYLWGINGQYVQADGGVSEGSLYYRFAFAPSLALSLAWKNRIREPRILKQDCRNRQTVEPWKDHGCVNNNDFIFDNLINEYSFKQTVDWFLNVRMPDGRRPPMEDSSLKDQNGSAIMASIMNRPDLLWDWENNHMNMGGGMDLKIQTLAYMPDDMEPKEPEFRNVILKDSGQAIFRSGWDTDAIWVMLNAEHGSSRMTVHDHIDSGNFTMSAYGEYLLIDTGYYKPDSSKNAVTSAASAHNLLTIEGEPVPPKGLLTDFGDTDAFFKNEYFSKSFPYVEAHQDIKKSRTERSLALVHDRYVVVFDRVVTTVTEPRKHQWRLHGNGGFEENTSFELTNEKANWEREKAGINVYLASTAKDFKIVEPPYEKDKVPHVDKIEGNLNNHKVIDGIATDVTPGFVAIAAPYKKGVDENALEAPLKVTKITANGIDSGFAAWKIEHKNGSEIAFIRSKTTPKKLTLSTGEKIDTDAEFAIITGVGNKTNSFMGRGTYLNLDEKVIFKGIAEEIAVIEQ